jgi:S1-C subfamily serine protease
MRAWVRAAARRVGLAVALAGLAGCGGGPAPQPTLVAPVEAQTPPLYFAGLTFAIPRGTRVGDYRFELGRCWPYRAHLYWGAGLLSPRNRAGAYGTVVEGVFDDAGLNVLKYRKDIFAGLDVTLPNPALVIGGDVVGGRFEVCDHYGWYSGDQLFEESGRVALEIDWRVFSLVERKVVYRETTTGVGHLGHGQPLGLPTMMEAAVGEAAARLTASQPFRDFVTGRGPLARKALARQAAAQAAQRGPRLTLAAQRELHGAITGRMDRIGGAVATVDTGAGHGSGFFVAPGVVLTNAHVVRGSRTVPLLLADGRLVTATVLRSNAARDVALLHVPAGSPAVLPIRRRPAAVAEPVYALGTPIRRSLAQTLSKGIVSALRENDDGLPVIQADVDVHAGNSGGPLLDAAGNVLGITYAGYSADGFSTGLNLFVPIGDALAGLNVALGEPPAPPETAAIGAAAQ